MLWVGFEELENFRAPVSEVPASAAQRRARTDSTPDDSKFLGLAALQLCESFCGQSVEPAFGRVLLNLSIPSLPVVFDKPRSERSELLLSELFNLFFDRFDFGHAAPNTRA